MGRDWTGPASWPSMNCSSSERRASRCSGGSGMFSEQEKQELKEMAASPAVRNEFALLDAASRAAQARMEVDQYVSFLTTMARLSPRLALPRSFVPHRIVRI